MSVLSACAEEWKNGTYASSEATILHLVQCLWKHVMVVKQYADKLCKLILSITVVASVIITINNHTNCRCPFI